MNEEHLNQILAEKAERRRAEEETNVTGSDNYSCATCFHLKTQACDGLSSLSKVCRHWYSPHSRIQGLAYRRQEVGLRPSRDGVVAAVADFLGGKSKKRRIQKQKTTQGQLFPG